MNNKLIVALSLLSISVTQAAYIVKIKLDNEIKFTESQSQWVDDAPLLGAWTNSGSVYNCSNWTPNENTVAVGVSFTQTASDCKQDQTQTVQEREVDTDSGTVRDKGVPYLNTRYIATSDSRLATGTLAAENWVTILPDYTTWIDSGAVVNCSNWSPATSTVTSGQSFTQTATDCQQPQTRSRQDREQETTTLAIRNLGVAVVENQNIPASSTRTATGTKAAKECLYDPIQYTWIQFFATTLTWNGQTIYDDSINENPTMFSSIVIGGFQYSRGADSPDAPGEYYYICREPI